MDGVIATNWMGWVSWDEYTKPIPIYAEMDYQEMASSSHRIAFEKLGDLRMKYPDSEDQQNYALAMQFPRRYNWRVGQGDQKTLGVGRYSEKEVCALDAVIIVLRRLLAIVSWEHRGVDDRNPFACMIWADLADEDGVEAQHQARFAILNRFQEILEGRPICFLNLMENEVMWETFWSLPALKLWHPTVLARKENPANELEKKWTKAEIEDPGNLIKVALIKYRGHKALGDYVTERNEPAVLRVLYDHQDDDTSPKVWNDLKRIGVNSHRLFRDEQVVRLGKDENDRIRLYDINGRCIQLPNQTLNYSGTEWRLGSPNDRYLLYYTPEPPRPLVGGDDNEVSYRPTNVKTFFSEAMTAITMKPRSRRDPIDDVEAEDEVEEGLVLVHQQSLYLLFLVALLHLVVSPLHLVPLFRLAPFTHRMFNTSKLKDPDKVDFLELLQQDQEHFKVRHKAMVAKDIRIPRRPKVTRARLVAERVAFLGVLLEGVVKVEVEGDIATQPT
ncbi:hypothetical protein K449DRAFT_437600 [Hypoxylon sp. EC38]|nr:hypothetical protein K449DRAFT_437600 [Hypoxylon sp. EC38]